MTYSMAFLSDLEWLSEIFNDMKHRAASLRQLSFLSANIVARTSRDLGRALPTRRRGYSKSQ